MNARKLIDAGLQGWGRHRTAWGLSAYPESIEQVIDLVTGENPGVLPRGMGRSYGDASLNAGRLTIHTQRLDHALDFDPERGELTCEAGLTLGALLRAFVPRGWTLPVTPGTSHPTIGGSVACDVHGKNHHVAGTLSRHVRWIDLITADGRVRRIGPDREPELFHATCGGMGLTGVIVRLCLQLRRIETAYIDEVTVRVESLHEMMDQLTLADRSYAYSAAWMDCAVSGSRLGRGHVLLGRDARPDQLRNGQDHEPLSVAGLRAVPVPIVPPLSLVNNLTVRIFNGLRLPTVPRRTTNRVIPFWPFYYPLDVASDWNRLYGPRGFVQYQFVVPFSDGERVIREIVVRCQSRDQLPALVVLKRMGDAAPGHLSFPIPGWTLAMDLPVKPDLWPLLEEFDRIVQQAGGRVYLVKDTRLSPEMFRAMYPRFGEWSKIKQTVDPEWRLESGLARRLRMREGA